MTFSEWIKKRWYIMVALCGFGAAFAQLFISNQHPVTIGLILAYGISYIIYLIEATDK